MKVTSLIIKEHKRLAGVLNSIKGTQKDVAVNRTGFQTKTSKTRINDLVSTIYCV